MTNNEDSRHHCPLRRAFRCDASQLTMPGNYILITPIKDELEHLNQLKECVLGQSVKPILWVIVCSYSKKESLAFAKSAFEGYRWIHAIEQSKRYETGYSHKNFAKAVNEGYAYGKSICSESGLEYGYVGKTDATPILSPDYFESLIREMENDSRLMIACGIQKIKYHGSLIDVKPSSNNLMGAFNDIRLYRKKFFEDMGGYPLAPSPDAILLIKACNRNLGIKIVESTYFIETRLSGAMIGVWKGNLLKGKNMYITGYHPLLMVLNSLYLTAKYPPHYQIVPLVLGYFSSLIRGTRKIEDRETLEYFGKTRLIQVIINMYNGGI
ncbi:MAG: glycosyltransferase family 2 protein [Candidatus Methanomethylicus sp.]|nr:glycosyltransferase family 2 protein [Candidatus Methanomethylicus sp.]